MAESKSELSDVETTAVDIIKDWVLNDAQFYGRSDEEFLVMFLRGCKFNIEKTKTKLIRYYENRKNYPEWWGQRDLKSETFLVLSKLRFTTLTRSGDVSRPAIAVTNLSRLGEKACEFNDYIKFVATALEVSLRNKNFQQNGIIWIIDFKGIPGWFAAHLLFPLVLYRFYMTFLKSMPILLKGMHWLNVDPVCKAIWKVVKPILSPKLRKRAFLYRSDWSSMFDHVPIDLIPEEYGGNAGPIELHEDEFYEKVASYADYFLDDNIYGMRS